MPWSIHECFRAVIEALDEPCTDDECCEDYFFMMIVVMAIDIYLFTMVRASLRRFRARYV